MKGGSLSWTITGSLYTESNLIRGKLVKRSAGGLIQLECTFGRKRMLYVLAD